MSKELEKVTITNKWGRYKAGKVIYVDSERAKTLIEKNFAVAGEIEPKKKGKNAS